MKFHKTLALPNSMFQSPLVSLLLDSLQSRGTPRSFNSTPFNPPPPSNTHTYSQSPYKSLLKISLLAGSRGGAWFRKQAVLLAGYGDVLYDDKFHAGVTLLPAGED